MDEVAAILHKTGGNAPPPKPGKQLRGVVLVIVLVFALLALGGFMSRYLARHGTILNYTQCIHASGSSVQGANPQICVTKGGSQFVNPAQQYSCGSYGWAAHPRSCR